MMTETKPIKTEDKQVSLANNASNDDVSHHEESSSDHEDSNKKRYLPVGKKPDAAPTFPEKMMELMKFADKECAKLDDPEAYCVSWMEDGKSLIIRNPDQFTREVVPKFFKPTKFSSFTRKLYRWGFRQLNRGIGPDDPIIFGSEHFQRDNVELITKMRSITAAATRKQEMQMTLQEQQQQIMNFFPSAAAQMGLKRPLAVSMMQQQQQQQMDDSMAMFGGAGAGFDPSGASNSCVEEHRQKRIMLERVHMQRKAQAFSNNCGANNFDATNPNSIMSMNMMGMSMGMNNNNNSNNFGSFNLNKMSDNYFSGMDDSGSMALTSALRPNIKSAVNSNNFNSCFNNNNGMSNNNANMMMMMKMNACNNGNNTSSFDMLMQQRLQQQQQSMVDGSADCNSLMMNGMGGNGMMNNNLMGGGNANGMMNNNFMNNMGMGGMQGMNGMNCMGMDNFMGVGNNNNGGNFGQVMGGFSSSQPQQQHPEGMGNDIMSCMPQMGGANAGNGNNMNRSSTFDIVNAAIAALDDSF